MTVELDDVPFSVVRRGYDRAQVEESLNSLRADLDMAVAARDAATEKVRALTRQLETNRGQTQTAQAENAELRSEIARLHAQVAELSTVPSTVDGMSERLQQMVRIAQDEVNDMRTRATANASQVLELAQAEADELRERSDNERREFEAAFQKAEESLRSQLAESQSRLDQLRNDSDGQRTRLAAELAERHKQAEEEFVTEMEQRRTAMLGELATQETRHREEAARILDAATQEARTRLAEATAEAQQVRAGARNGIDTAQRELEDLRTLQHQVAEQLTSVRALLDWTLPQLGAGAVRPAGNGAAHDGEAGLAVEQPVEPADDGAHAAKPPTDPAPATPAIPQARNGDLQAAGRPTPEARASGPSAQAPTQR